MIKSQLSISGVTGVGKATPPSTSIRSSFNVGSIKPGIDELCTTASIKLPDLYMIEFPDIKSVVVTNKGIFKSLNCLLPKRISAAFANLSFLTIDFLLELTIKTY